MTVHALIADDEPLARKRLRDLLADVEWIDRVTEAADGPSTVRAVDREGPDILFLDIQMPGFSGIEVLQQMQHRAHVIFTTAYDRYAVTAFELQALDYLLKPFGVERFRRAITRARDALADEPRGPDSDIGRAARALSRDGRITRLFVREGGKIIPVALDAIERLEARGDYVAVHTGERRYLVHVRLRDFEKRLDGDRFLRIHRSHIVNLDHVVAFESYDGTRLEVRLASGARIVASRTQSKILRRLVM